MKKLIILLTLIATRAFADDYDWQKVDRDNQEIMQQQQIEQEQADQERQIQQMRDAQSQADWTAQLNADRAAQSAQQQPEVQYVPAYGRTDGY